MMSKEAAEIMKELHYIKKQIDAQLDKEIENGTATKKAREFEDEEGQE